jgi:hypothetical protein
MGPHQDVLMDELIRQSKRRLCIDLLQTKRWKLQIKQQGSKEGHRPESILNEQT